VLYSANSVAKGAESQSFSSVALCHSTQLDILQPLQFLNICSFIVLTGLLVQLLQNLIQLSYKQALVLSTKVVKNCCNQQVSCITTLMLSIRYTLCVIEAFLKSPNYVEMFHCAKYLYMTRRIINPMNLHTFYVCLRSVPARRCPLSERCMESGVAAGQPTCFCISQLYFQSRL